MSASTAIPADLLARVQRRLAADHAEPDPVTLARVVRDESTGIVDETHVLALIRALERELSGAGPLAPLLDDPDTTDVVVNGPSDVRVDRGRGWRHTDVTFADEEAVQRLARRLAASCGQRLDDAHPFADGLLAGGVRLHAALAPLAATGTCLSLRVLRPTRYSLSALRDGGSLPGLTYSVLRAVLAARLAFVISGGTGSGKTTLLAAMLGDIDPAERIVIVEDAEELHPAHPHVVRLVSRGANIEGTGAIGVRALVRQALRMRPDRLVVGEVRGPEVVDMMAALSTGHDGGAGTVHANSAADVPVRLAGLAAYAGMDPAVLHREFASAVQIIAHMRAADGRRRLTELAVVVRADGPARVVPVIVDGRPSDGGTAALAELLDRRGVSVPW